MNTNLLAVSSQWELNSYQETCNNITWTNSMRREINTLEKNGTWIIINLSQKKRAIGHKLVYKIKYNVNDTTQRYKAQLVARGFIQKKGLDCHQDFSPIAKITIMRLLFALAIT